VLSSIECHDASVPAVSQDDRDSNPAAATFSNGARLHTTSSSKAPAGGEYKASSKEPTTHNKGSAGRKLPPAHGARFFFTAVQRASLKGKGIACGNRAVCLDMYIPRVNQYRTNLDTLCPCLVPTLPGALQRLTLTSVLERPWRSWARCGGS